MKSSKLYLFINRFLNTSLLPFKFDVFNKGLREAFIYNLSDENVPFMEVELNNQTIRLRNHHISLDKHVDKENTALSTYHYTAYFSGGGQLHVYFDENDKPSGCQLSMGTGPDDLKKVSISEEVEQSLIELAKQNTLGFIKQVRSAHLKQTQDDLSQLKALDDELIGLSTNLQENREAYLQKIKEAIELLESMQSYHEDSDYCLILLSHFKRIQQNLSARPQPSFFSPQENAQEEDKAPLELASPSEKTESPSQKRVSEKTNLLQAVDAASVAYQAFIQSINDPKVSAKNRISFLLKSIESTQALNELSARARYTVELPVLEKTRMLMQKNEAGRLQLLELLLAGGKIAEAKTLPKSLRNLPQGKAISLVYLALAKANKELLQFILENNVLSINDLSMPNNKSLVMYCFGLQDKPGIAACLSLLVKHGASLTELEPKQNLPLAHLILSDIKHPFQQVLDDNKDRTLFNRQLYKEIIRLIGKHKPLSDFMRAKILGQYKNALETMDDSMAGKQTLSIGRQALVVGAQCLSPEFILLARFDEDIQVKYAEFEVAASFYYDNVSTKEKTALNLNLKDIIKSEKGRDSLKFTSNETLKKLVLLLLDYELAKTEASNCGLRATKFVKTNKERNRLNAEQRNWFEKAKQLESQCGAALASAALESDIAQMKALFEQFGKMSEQLNEITDAEEKDAWLAEHPEEDVINRFSFYKKPKSDAPGKTKDNDSDDEFGDVPDFLDFSMGING